MIIYYHLIQMRRLIDMNKISISKATYDLAFEYMKENQMLKISSDNTLNKRMEEFEKAYNEIYSVLDNKNILK